MMKRILLLLLLFPVCIFAQQQEVFHIDSLPKEGVLLNQGWKWHAGDNPEWAKPEFDDAKWEDIDPSKEVVQLTNISSDQPLWLRIKLSPKAVKNYALSISQSGASEIYLNGHLIQKIGQIDPGNQHTIAYNPLDDHLILKLDSLDNTLAIRYYFQPGLNLDPIYNIRYHLFSARILDGKYIIASHNSNFWSGFNIGFGLILFFIHGVLFVYYPPLRANFWFSAWAFINTFFSYCLFQLEMNPFLEHNAQYLFFSFLLSLLSSFCLIYCLYLLLENIHKFYVYLFVTLNFANIIGYYFLGFETRDILGLVLFLFQALLWIAMALDANRVGDRRGMPVLYGTLAYVTFWILFSISYPLSWSQISKDILFHLAIFSFPVTISALLGFRFRQVNQSLLHNLEQVNQLYVEKQQILAAQNETLEKQVTARTAELEHKNRDLEIEASLEKVRTRALEMQKSEHLVDVINVVAEQLLQLNFQLNTASFFLNNDSEEFTFWLAAIGESNPEKIVIPKLSNPALTNIKEAQKNGVDFWADNLSFEEKNAWFQHVFDHSPGRVPEHRQEYIFNTKGYARSVVLMKHIGLFIVNYVPQPYTDAENAIFKRFAFAFEQAYIRFLDLQKAEAQAREAQVEAALERVRARAMSMQTSEEINAVIGKIFTECKSLEIQLDSSIILIYDKQTLDTNWYLTNNEDPDYPACFSVPYNEYPFNTAMLHAWHQKTIDWDYILDVQEKKEWDQFIFSKTDFVLLPDHIKEVMAAVEKLYIKASFNEFGCLMLTSLSPLNNEQMTILPRFSKVFELTYTRFNDLKIAEAQAEQAKLDLIQIQTEKKKAEDTLVELRATQAQLIQSEKLASLGELTAGIAHEIQNPLNFVNNFSELSVELAEELKEEINKPELDKGLIEELAADLATNQEKINHHGKRASSIVKGMLEHSRMGDAMNRVSTDLNALADEYLRLAYHGLRAKDSGFNATMETHFDPDLPKIEVIPQDIGRVLLNLINNAFYAVAERSRSTVAERSRSTVAERSRSTVHQRIVETLHATSLQYEPTVSISTQKIGNQIIIKVKDNGNGIPEAIKDKIFQPFFTTKPTGQGTGLGLSLAYDIVTKGHGGTLTLGQSYNGTLFEITLPLS